MMIEEIGITTSSQSNPQTSVKQTDTEVKETALDKGKSLKAAKADNVEVPESLWNDCLVPDDDQLCIKALGVLR
jgi:hypothetical protein